MTRRPTYADRRTLGRVMVGRAADLGVLRRLCRSASAGAGGAALVEGVAGAGKTTLLRALVDEVSDLDALWGRAPQEGGTPAYWPWREIASAAGWDVAWQGSTDLWSLGAELTARISQSARVRPMLLLVDDLHAADDDTLRLTAYLASVLRDSPVALVVAARPDERLSTIARACEVVDLTPLDRAESDEVIDQHASAPLSAEARSTIRRVAEGNPLVLRELSRTSGSGRLPREVRASVEQRLATLDRPTRQTVDSAAVLGREFDLRDLAALLARGQVEVAALLRPLHDHGLMSQRRGPVVLHPPGGPRRGLRGAARGAAPERSTVRRRSSTAGLPGPAAARRASPSTCWRPCPQWTRRRWSRPPGQRRASPRAGRRPAKRRRTSPAPCPWSRRADHGLELLLELGDARLAAGAVHDAVTVFAEAERLALRLGDEPRHARALLGRSARVETSSSALDLVPALQDAARALEWSGRGRPRGLAALPQRDPAGGQRTVGPGDRRRRRRARTGAGDRRPPRPGARPLGHARLHLGPGTRGDRWRPQPRAGRGRGRQRRPRPGAGGPGGPDGRRAARRRPRLLDESLAGAAAIAHRSGSPRHEFFVLSRRAMRVLIDGRLGEARSLLTRAHEIGIAIEEPDTIQVFWGTQFLVLSELNAPGGPARLRGRPGPVGRSGAGPRRHRGQLPRRGGRRRVRRSAAATRAGRSRGCRRSRPPTSPCWCSWPRSPSRSATRRSPPSWSDALRPFAGSMAVNAGAVTFCGAVDHWLGLLAAAQGHTGRARTLLSGAVETYAAMGASWFSRKAETELAALEDPRGPDGTGRPRGGARCCGGRTAGGRPGGRSGRRPSPTYAGSVTCTRCSTHRARRSMPRT